MELFNDKMREYVKRLLVARMRILCNHGFYGLLLMHMKYSVDDSVETACTDGERIIFGPDFLDDLSDAELDFILMHEILHVVLQHCFRGADRDPEKFNVATDIVVNSNIMHENGDSLRSITLAKYGVSMHTAPNGKEGYLYTAEEVYEMMPPSPKASEKGSGASSDDKASAGFDDTPDGVNKKQRSSKSAASKAKSWDDHTHWGKEDNAGDMRDKWLKHLDEACEAISIREASKSFGGVPMFAQRLLAREKFGQIDWRAILQNFLQEEIVDYSFSPPDRRFDDCPFFLPDFNEKDTSGEASNIWFLIDTSGSISDAEIDAAYAEIRSAIEQFNGKLSGYLSFTESYVTEPVPFSNVTELMEIKPVGGGGNDFSDIFRYMQKNMTDDLPAYIIIITDGYDTFPDEKEALGVPVLWLINNEDAEPPWGKVARIKV